MVSPGAIRSGPVSPRAGVATRRRRRLRTAPRPSAPALQKRRPLASVFELKQHPVLRDIVEITLSIRLPVAEHEPALERARQLMTESRLHRVVLLVADAWSFVVELPAEGIHRGLRSRTQLFCDADVAHGLRVVEAPNRRGQHAGDTGVPTPAAFEVALELENADRAGSGGSGVKVDLP